MLKFRKKHTDVPLSPVRFQVVTTDEFLKLYNEKRSDILSAKIIPPKLGSDNFGMILIEWKTPIFMPILDLDNEVFA